MGSRILIQCYSQKRNHFGPVLYCHWALPYAREIVRALKKHMKNRVEDVDYSSARLVQVACNDNQNTGFGLWNAKTVLTKADSEHHVTDIVLINVDDFTCQCFGGYYQIDEQGLPFRLND